MGTKIGFKEGQKAKVEMKEFWLPMYYFRMVMRSESITKAAKSLDVSPSSITETIGKLSDEIGLLYVYNKNLRKIELTEEGRRLLPYANEIYEATKRLANMVDNPGLEPKSNLRVGVTLTFPKILVKNILCDFLHLDEQFYVISHRARFKYLLEDLDQRKIDAILCLDPVPNWHPTEAFSISLGGCKIALMANKSVAKAYARKFPLQLDNVPFLLPADNSNLRSALDHWFRSLVGKNIKPRVLGEFDDQSLMMSVAKNENAVFPCHSLPTSLLKEEFNNFEIIQEIPYQQNFYLVTRKEIAEEEFIVKMEGKLRDLLKS